MACSSLGRSVASLGRFGESSRVEGERRNQTWERQLINDRNNAFLTGAATGGRPLRCGQPVPQTLARDVSRKSEGLVIDRFALERPLTERQIAVLQYLRNGCTNRKIAEYMGVQPRTVKDWLKHLYLLFFVSNRTQLVAGVFDLSERPFAPPKRITAVCGGA